MDHQFKKEMETRISRLESKNRLLTWTVLALLGVNALLFTLSAANAEAVPDVVKARSFEVVDVEGNTRVGLQMLGDRMPSLILNDAKGVRRLTIASLGDDGSPLITLHSDKGKVRVDMGYYPGGVPRLRLGDESGEILFMVP